MSKFEIMSLTITKDCRSQFFNGNAEQNNPYQQNFLIGFSLLADRYPNLKNTASHHRDQ